MGLLTLEAENFLSVLKFCVFDCDSAVFFVIIKFLSALLTFSESSVDFGGSSGALYVFLSFVCSLS